MAAKKSKGNKKDRTTAATINRLLAECGEHQFVVVAYDEHGKVRVPPEIAPIERYEWAGVSRLGSPFRALLEIHDLPEPDDSDEDAPVSRLVITPVVTRTRAGAA